MGHYDPPLSYDEMLDVFKSALSHVLSGNLLPHDTAIFNVPVILSLLDIAHAARQGRPTETLVTRATETFAAYAADFAVEPGQPAPRSAAYARAGAAPELKIAN